MEKCFRATRLTSRAYSVLNLSICSPIFTIARVTSDDTPDSAFPVSLIFRAPDAISFMLDCIVLVESWSDDISSMMLPFFWNISFDALRTSIVPSFIFCSAIPIWRDPSRCSSIAHFICMTRESVSLMWAATEPNALFASVDEATTSPIDERIFLSCSPIERDCAEDVSESVHLINPPKERGEMLS